jgi:arginine/ornithine transport system permease protein
MNLELIAENWAMFAHGVWITISLVALSLLGGFILGLPLAIAQAYRIPFLKEIAVVYSYAFRGTPLLVQLYLIYYGLAQFETVRNSIFWFALSNSYICALISFTLNSAAYVSEIYRGAIVAVDKGEIEAARATGMTQFQTITQIVIPQALRTSLPAYSNEVIFLLHASVIVSTITLVDILGAGRSLNSSYYVVYEGLLTAAALYLIIVMVISWIFRRAEANFLSFRV